MSRWSAGEDEIRKGNAIAWFNALQPRDHGRAWENLASTGCVPLLRALNEKWPGSLVVHARQVMWYAARNNHVEVARWLFNEHRINPNQRDVFCGPKGFWLFNCVSALFAEYLFAHPDFDEAVLGQWAATRPRRLFCDTSRIAARALAHRARARWSGLRVAWFASAAVTAALAAAAA